MYRFSKLTLIDVLMVTFILTAGWMAADLLIFSSAKPQQSQVTYPLLPTLYQGSWEGNGTRPEDLPSLPGGLEAMPEERASGLPLGQLAEQLTRQHKKNKAALEHLDRKQSSSQSVFDRKIDSSPRRTLIDI